jgi:peptidoglycan hydrolase-like protein with peptidoglycan-binding domain
MTQVQTPVGGALEVEEQEVVGASCPQTVRRGSSGYAVTVLQRCLNARGAMLTVDGLFGPSTEREVKEWQVRSGLRCDGVVGPATWGSLDQC